MTVLWTAQDAATATGGTTSGIWQAEGISIDSRTTRPGDLFIALQGPNFDGHDYVAAALDKGAVGALVHRLPQDLEEDSRLLLVGDTMEGLRGLARFARARSEARIIAVTGSVGKTSTKEMLKLALSAQGPTHASAGSLNNHWGVPLSLALLPPGARFAVFEIGMNHAGEIIPLTRLVRPHVAVVTTVEAAHMEFFTSTLDIAYAKAEIFAGLEPGGIAVLPRDNAHYALLVEAAEAKGARCVSFGHHLDALARLIDVAIDSDGTRVFSLIQDRPQAYLIGVVGVQWAVNSLAVLLASDAVGADLPTAAKSLAGMSAPKGRGQRHRIRLAPELVIELIDESYNASPVSVRAAIAALAAVKPRKGGRRIAVLGDMLELGPQSLKLHTDLAESLRERAIDLVFTAGPLTAALYEALPTVMRGGQAENSDALAPLVRSHLRNGDLVMIKGSAGSRMGRIVESLLAAHISLPVSTGQPSSSASVSTGQPSSSASVSTDQALASPPVPGGQKG